MRVLLLALVVASSIAIGEDRSPISVGLEKRTGFVVQSPRAANQPFSWPPGVKESSVLSRQDAVAVALWNNAQLEADLAGLGIAKADLLEAGLLKNPNLWSLLPVGGKPFEVLVNWPIEELWQRKRRIAAAQKNLETAAAGLEQNGLTLIRDVAVAHADLWLAQERARALAESAGLRSRIAELTGRRKEAGDASGLDVSIAATDARSAQELSVRAEGDIAIARVRLCGLLGMRGDTRPLVALLSDPKPAIDGEPQLLEGAFQGRPDLRAAELGVEAAAARAKWQRTRVLNMLTVILSIKPTGSPLETRIGPGAQLEIPIFNRNQGQIARADAEVIQAGWRYAAQRDRVEMEVRESRQRLVQASRVLEQIRGQVRPVVEQSVGQAEQLYRNGDASLLNVLEATRQRYDVMLRELDAQATERRALAELERSVGRTL